MIPPIEPVPPGRWAIGVSGGADSVALLRLLASRPELSLHVVHLDHQLRGAHSEGDSAFVVDLAATLGLPCTVARRDQIEPDLLGLPANPSARYRQIRLELFRQVVGRNNLAGVILAHHADDQAETILLRLLRGAGFAGLRAMAPRARIDGLCVLRPALGLRWRVLREVLTRLGQPWREDQSNQSSAYMRNRIRRWLAHHLEMVQPLLDLGASARRLNRWIVGHAPALPDAFSAGQLTNLPAMLARQSLRQWLVRHGAPPAKVSGDVLDRLWAMIADAAMPPVRQFPGNLKVRRTRGLFRCVSPLPSAAPPSPERDPAP